MNCFTSPLAYQFLFLMQRPCFFRREGQTFLNFCRIHWRPCNHTLKCYFRKRKNRSFCLKICLMRKGITKNSTSGKKHWNFVLWNNKLFHGTFRTEFCICGRIFTPGIYSYCLPNVEKCMQSLRHWYIALKNARG